MLQHIHINNTAYSVMQSEKSQNRVLWESELIHAIKDSERMNVEYRSEVTTGVYRTQGQ